MSDSPVAEIYTLVVTDLVDSTKLTQEQGNAHVASALQRHDRIVRDLLQDHEGIEADRTDGFLLLFKRPIQAVDFAIAFHSAMKKLSGAIGFPMHFRVGIHLGEVILIHTPKKDVDRGAKPLEVEGLAKPTAARLMSLAGPGQTLLSQSAFDMARQAAIDQEGDTQLEWVAHGQYSLKGVAEARAVFEVGRRGEAPLKAPEDTEKVRRLIRDSTVTGWRPSIGQRIPSRAEWTLEEQLGEGGFGEVWLAKSTKTKEHRAFKFCFDKDSVRALQREIMLFRLFKETLGQRDDIAKIIDWSFDRAPYYIESEYSAGGNLEQWSESRGGLNAVPLQLRLEFCAQIADALAAAHSVGVLHKDVKPTNVLIAGSREQPRAVLTDFGIGEITDSTYLFESGITVLGATPSTLKSIAAGTPLYQAPEILEGKVATLQADVYALGVLLYQMVIGDLHRALASGWKRDVDDEILREIIADAVDGSPERRTADASLYAERLRNLEKRREALEMERRTRRELENAEHQRKKRQVLTGLLGVSLAIILLLGYLAKRASDGERAAQKEVLANQQTADFLVGLFKSADPRSVPEDFTVRDLVDRGTKEIRKELAEQPILRAHLLSVLGEVYINLGASGTALELLVEALDLQRSRLDRDDPNLVRTMLALGRAYQFGEEAPEKAKESFLEALQIVEADSSPGGRLQTANVLNHLGVFFAFYANDCQTAMNYYQQAIQIWGTNSESFAALNNLAICLWSEENYEEAEESYIAAQKIGLEALGAAHPDVISIDHNLGILYQDTGRCEEGWNRLSEALRKRRALLGPDHHYVGTSLRSMARASICLEKFGRAEVELRQAFQVFEDLIAKGEFAERHSDLGKAYVILAKLQLLRERREEAATAFNSALEILGEEAPEVKDLRAQGLP